MKNAETISKNSSHNFSLQQATFWVVVFTLAAAGLVMVYSSSFIFAQEKFHDGLYFFRRHLAFLAAGFAAFLFGLKFPVTRYQKLSNAFLVAAVIALCLVFIPHVGHRVGGAVRWIRVFGFQFQPSEFAKFAVLVFVASQISKKISHQTNWRTGFLTYFLGAIPVYLLLLKQPDFGTVALLSLTTIAMLIGSGSRLKYLFVSLAVFIPTAMALVLNSKYRRDRILGFLDPWSDPAHKGFQIIQSLLAFFSGSWFGVGLGNSHEKLFYLPEAHNDFIFAVIGEELGFFGVLIFVSLFFFIVWRGLTTAARMNEHFLFEKALAIGIASIFGLQSFFNVGVVLGMLPTKGLPLPLISYGGSSLLFSFFILGILSQLNERAECA